MFRYSVLTFAALGALLGATASYAHGEGSHGTVAVVMPDKSVLPRAGIFNKWKVDFNQSLSPSMTRDWSVSKVTVTIPSNVTTSERNSYAPKGDIVWHGDVYDGNRFEQVRKLVEYGALRGSDLVLGSHQVHLDVEVLRFHAITPKARNRLNKSGVHNIILAASIHDAKTGQVLVEPTLIDASLAALVGDAAYLAESEGQTQKVRIADHLSLVFRDWLGYGPVVREEFERVGR